MAFRSRTIIALVKVAIAMVSMIHHGLTEAVKVSSGPENTTVIVGQNLTLTCTFFESVDVNFNILWKDPNKDVGRCQMPYACITFGNSGIFLKESNRTRFELKVINVSLDDSGSYECGIENRSTENLRYSRLQAAVVSVVQESGIINPSCSVQISESVVNGGQLDITGTLTQLTCTWPRNYRGALGQIVVPSRSNLTSSVEVNSLAKNLSISMTNRLLSSEGESQCLLTMAGLQSRRSCTFSRNLSPPVARIAEGETAEFRCNSLNTDAVFWFALNNGTVIGRFASERESVITMTALRTDNGLIIICATRDGTGKLILSGSGKLFVTRRTTIAPQTINDPLGFSPSSSSTQSGKEHILSTDSYAVIDGNHKVQEETTNEKSTTAPSIQLYVPQVAINSNNELSPNSFPLWIEYLVYYCSIASSLALALAILTIAYFCVMHRRRKTVPQEDEEQQPQVAKVVAIPSHTSADYATIDSSELKLKRQKFYGTVDPRERKESCRYFQPDEIAPMTTGTVEVAFIPDGYATPSIPKRRTQSEYRPNNCDDPTNFDTSNGRHRWRNMSLQEPIPYRVDTTESRFQKIASIDEESTICSQASVLNKKGQSEVFYFPLDEMSTSNEQSDDVDNKTIKSSTSEETTLGRNEHPYFTLEQAPQSNDIREINICETKSKITTNNTSVGDIDADSNYDNFRSKRIPYVRENSPTDHYEKLKCNSKG